MRSTFCLLLLSPLCAAADGLALMKESDKRIKEPDESVEYSMELYDAGQLVHSRQLLRLDRLTDKGTDTLIRFLGPAAVKNVGLLIHDTGAAINDIWSYTPATKSLRRIAGSQKQNWFMGTEFTYEDFEGYKLNAYRFEDVGVLAPCMEWAKCTMIDAIPSAEAEAGTSGYSRKRYYIEQATLYPVRIDYYDHQGKEVKRLETEGLKTYPGFSRPQAQTMSNLVNGRKTRMVVRKLTIKSGFNDSQFTQRALREEQ